jgi:hypothetical protein
MWNLKGSIQSPCRLLGLVNGHNGRDRFWHQRAQCIKRSVAGLSAEPGKP